jgi:hypothetical protein
MPENKQEVNNETTPLELTIVRDYASTSSCLEQTTSFNFFTVRSSTSTEELGSLEAQRREIRRFNRANFPSHLNYETLYERYGYHQIDAHHTPDFLLDINEHTLCFQNMFISNILHEADNLPSESTMSRHARQILETFKDLATRFPDKEIPFVFNHAVYQLERKTYEEECLQKTHWIIKLCCCIYCT